jgi:hypothetical protein
LASTRRPLRSSNFIPTTPDATARTSRLSH